MSLHIPVHRLRPAFVTACAVVALTTGAVIPASASPVSPSSTATAPTAPTSSTSQPVVVDGMNLDDNGNAIVNNVQSTDIAPGLVHVSYERLDASGWEQVNVLKARVGPSTVRVGYLSPPTVAGDGSTVTDMVNNAGAVAGVNLDRFDINNTNAVAGWGIKDGQILKSGNSDASASVVFDANGLGHLTDLLLEGGVNIGNMSLPIGGINVSSLPSGVGVFTSDWGAVSRSRAVADRPCVEVLLNSKGVVTSVADSAGSDALPKGTMALLTDATWPEAATLSSLKPGDTVKVSYSVNSGALKAQEAAGAWNRTLTAGVATAPTGDTTTAPRTMVGLSADGATVYLVEVDGRSSISRGLTLDEEGQFMKELGAYDAFNADGGGSSQMNLRAQGDQSATVVNTPSDGTERKVGNGLGLFLSQPSSGKLTGFTLKPTIDPDDALRVFPGLSRSVTAKGHDEAGTAVSTKASTWRSSAGSVAHVAAGTVTGLASGSTTIIATRGSATGDLPVTVLGGLTRLSANTTAVDLEQKGASATVSITGYDAQGFDAPVEPSDVKVTNPDPATFAIKPGDNGSFTVTARGKKGSTTATFTVAGQQVHVALAVPLAATTVNDFSDPGAWSTANDRATNGSIEAGAGHDGHPSLKMTYDFTTSTATRGQYAVAPGATTADGGIAIAGRPQKLSVWAKGDGHGSLLRLQVRQADSTVSQLDSMTGAQPGCLTSTDWVQYEFPVPATFQFPVTLQRIRVLETDPTKQYTGSVEFAQVEAYVPPSDTPTPATDRVEDPAVVAAGGTAASPLRVAVVSDAQFVARDPGSFQEQGLRKSLAEVEAAKPDVLFLDGDIVDEGSAADLTYAKQVLDDSLTGATFPWYYIPGNHEVMGSDISGFENIIGPTHQTLDIKGTRFILLDSSSGRLGSDFPQMQMLQTQLASAANDPSITGVVLVSHMPPNDPLPTKASQLTDRNEAQMITDWLANFRATSGKSAGYVAGHVGAFNTSVADGVTYVVNGNSGKDPATTPDNGGFTGWTMLGIDPAQGNWNGATGRWMSVETKPRVDPGGLQLQAPAQLQVGDTASTQTGFAQDISHGGRQVPATAWPISYAWGGSNVFVGSASEAPAGTVVAIDPVTSAVTGVAPGTASLTITVNNATASASVTVPSNAPVQPTPSPSASASAGGQLPSTGAPSPLLAVTGIAVLFVGLAGMRLARRRARES